MANPNFLILDEPTNDLDIVTLNVLEDYLMDFPGCLLVVSHDRYFMDKIVDHLFILEGEGKIKDYNGTYTEYRAANPNFLSNDRPKQEKPQEETSNEKKKEVSYEDRKRYNKLLKEVEKLEKKKEELTDKFNDMSMSQEDITKYSKELNEVEEKLEEKELEWMELAEELGM